VLSIVALAMAVACGASSSTQSSTPINVGLVAEFTGPRAALGPAKLQGMQLAADEINAAGGVLGHKVKIVPIDSPDPVDTVTALRKALATNNLKMVVGPDVNSYQTALPILEQDKMVNFTFIGTPGVYIQHHWTYSFRTSASDAFVGTAMTYYAHEKGYQRIALVFDAEEGSQSLVPAIQAVAKSLGMTIVANEDIPQNITSNAGYIEQVVNAHPDAMLYQEGTADMAGFFFKQWKQLGIPDLPIIGSDFTANADYVNAIGADFAKAHLTSIIPSLGDNTPAGTYFLDKFRAKYNSTPQLYAPHFYDGLIIGALAMIDANSTDPSVYVKDVMDVTSDAPGHQVVYTFAEGAKLLREGKKIKYSGAGGPMTYNSIHTVTGPYQAVQVTPSGETTVIANISAKALLPFTKGTD